MDSLGVRLVNLKGPVPLGWALEGGLGRPGRQDGHVHAREAGEEAGVRAAQGEHDGARVGGVDGGHGGQGRARHRGVRLVEDRVQATPSRPRSVSGVPSWNVTPSRRWNVRVVPSADASQLSARPGTTLRSWSSSVSVP